MVVATFAWCPILISGCGMSMLLCRLHECIDVHCCALLLVSMDTWCWSTRTPWILAVPGPLACSADGVVYQRSGTVGANATRCAALLAPGVGDGPTKKAVIFWWSSWTSQENGDCIRLVIQELYYMSEKCKGTFSVIWDQPPDGGGEEDGAMNM